MISFLGVIFDREKWGHIFGWGVINNVFVFHCFLSFFLLNVKCRDTYNNGFYKGDYL